MFPFKYILQCDFLSDHTSNCYIPVLEEIYKKIMITVRLLKIFLETTDIFFIWDFLRKTANENLPSFCGTVVSIFIWIFLFFFPLFPSAKKFHPSTQSFLAYRWPQTRRRGKKEEGEKGKEGKKAMKKAP